MELNAKQLSNHIGVPYTTLLSWVNSNLIHPVRRTGKPRTPVMFDRKGLREAKILTKLRGKADPRTLRRVTETLEKWGDQLFSSGDSLVIEEKGEESSVQIRAAFEPLDITQSDDLTMILPLYPIEQEIDAVAQTIKDLGLPSKSIVATEQKEILRTFTARIERIDKGLAYISLIDNQSRQSYAECPLQELSANGIPNPDEGMIFTCNIERREKETSLSFKPITRRQLTADEIRQIDSELEDDFPDDETDHDY
jgi:hypothetical protein